MGPVTLLRSSMLAIDAFEKSMPSGIAHRISVSGRTTSAYDRSSLPTIFAPAIPGPLGWRNGAASGSATSHARIPVRIDRSGLHFSVFAVSLVGSSGLSLGPTQRTSCDGGAAHEGALGGAQLTEFLAREFLQSVGVALLLVRDLRENSPRKCDREERERDAPETRLRRIARIELSRIIRRCG